MTPMLVTIQATKYNKGADLDGSKKEIFCSVSVSSDVCS